MISDFQQKYLLGNQLEIAAPTIALFSFRSLKELNVYQVVKN